MDEILKPATEWELKSMISALAERHIPAEIIGAGSKRGVGRPVSAPVALMLGAIPFGVAGALAWQVRKSIAPAASERRS